MIEDGRGPRKDLEYQAKELGLYPLSRVKAYVEHYFRINLAMSGFKTRHGDMRMPGLVGQQFNLTNVYGAPPVWH